MSGALLGGLPLLTGNGGALLGAAFLNPVLLGGLGLAALPVLIHLLSRRRFRRVRWGATRFLLEAEHETRRRVRFEQWLLVALRTAIVALLVLLVARPFARSSLAATLLGGRGQVQRILIIDDSPSLSYTEGAGTQFDTLRKSAVRLLARLNDAAPGCPVTVWRTSQPGEPVVSETPASAALVEETKRRLADFPTAHVRAHPRRVLGSVADRLRDRPGLTAADIYVLSDLQRSDLVAGDESAGSMFAPLTELSAGAAAGRRDLRVVLVGVAGEPRPNVAILNVSPERSPAIVGLPIRIVAEVANYSDRMLDELVIEAEAVELAPSGVRAAAGAEGSSLGSGTDSPRARQRTQLPPTTLRNVPPHGRPSATFEVTFTQPGYQELVVSLGMADGLVLDDERRIAVAVREGLKVLLVDGEPAADPAQDEVYLARSALAPPGPMSSGIQVDVIAPNELEATNLPAYDCVLLCNVPPPGEGAVLALENYAREGGGMVFFLGPAIGDVAEFNRTLFAEGRGLLPVPLKGIVRPPGDPPGVGLSSVRDHPVTGAFAAADAANPAARFRAFYVTSEPSAEAVAQGDADLTTPAASTNPAENTAPAVVLARFDDAARTPAWIERPFGRGRVLLFASTIDLDWNDWARSVDGSYVVTLLELVQYLAAASDYPLDFAAGDSLELLVPHPDYEPQAVLRPPNYPAAPAVGLSVVGMETPVGQPLHLQGPELRRIGSYELALTRRGGGNETRPLCVNLPAEESDLTTAREMELHEALADLPHELMLSSDRFLREEERTRFELWPGVLVCLVALLMLEQFLGWWFGRPRGVPGQRRTRAAGGLLSRPRGTGGRAASGTRWRASGHSSSGSSA